MNKFYISILFSFFIFSLNAQDASTAKIDQLIEDGYNLYESGDYQAAIKKYEAILEMDDKNLVALAEIALTYHAIQKYDDCIKYCKKAIKHHKNEEALVSVYVTYGNTLDMMGNTKKSKKIYTQGIKKFPNSSMLHFNYGITLAKENNIESALENFQISSQLNPYHTSSHYLQSLMASELRMDIPSILAGWRFIILEPTGERAKIIQQGISNIIKGSAKTTGDNQITITLDGIMGKEKKENDFSSIKMLIDLGGALDLDETQIKKTDQEKFLSKVVQICSMLSNESGSKKGFYWEYYAPYFNELYTEGHADAFTYLFLISTNDDEVQDWMEKNGDKIDDFYKWSETYEWK